MKSVTKVDFKVSLPKSMQMPGAPQAAVMVQYSDLCITGGILNAYKAVQLAMKK